MATFCFLVGLTGNRADVLCNEGKVECCHSNVLFSSGINWELG